MNPVLFWLKQRAAMLVPDKMYLSMLYRVHFRRALDWKHPSTFNEKLQWLKLYNRRPEYVMMVDKFQVKDYVASMIGREYIIPTLGVWESASAIDWDSLPDKFVLKCTHDSGGIVICKDRSALDIRAAARKLDSCLRTRFYYLTREWPYKGVTPRIIAEPYMEDSVSKELVDYKFFCFNGKAKFLFVATDRNKEGEETKFDFFDMDYRHLPVTNGHPNAEVPPAKPERFDEMVRVAEKLSSGIPHVRIDLYQADGRVYFGEMTFFHWSGMVPFSPESWDRVFGECFE